MRPDNLVHKPLKGGSSGGAQNHGYLQNSSYRTNRYLNTNSANLSTSSNAMDTNSNGQISTSTCSFSRDAKNFHKSLRKPPKGVYLNYDELVELAQVDNDKIFEQLNRRLISLKQQVEILFLRFYFYLANSYKRIVTIAIH